jgi:hypothetical protein
MCHLGGSLNVKYAYAFLVANTSGWSGPTGPKLWMEPYQGKHEDELS